MKTKFPLIVILTVLFISPFFLSCEKDGNIPPTDTPPCDTVFLPSDTVFLPSDTVFLPSDTVFLPSDTLPTKTPEEILTANPWKIQKIRTLQNSTFYFYQRGSANTDLDNEYIMFKTDHTGTYVAPNGAQSAITSWNFVDTEKTMLEYTIAFSTPLTVNWENLQLSTTSIKYGEYHALNNDNWLSIATRIPK